MAMGDDVVSVPFCPLLVEVPVCKGVGGGQSTIVGVGVIHPAGVGHTSTSADAASSALMFPGCGEVCSFCKGNDQELSNCFKLHLKINFGAIKLQFWEGWIDLGSQIVHFHDPYTQICMKK